MRFSLRTASLNHLLIRFWTGSVNNLDLLRARLIRTKTTLVSPVLTASHGLFSTSNFGGNSQGGIINFTSKMEKILQDEDGEKR